MTTESFQTKFGDVGRMIAESLLIFSLDVVSEIVRYTMFRNHPLPNQHEMYLCRTLGSVTRYHGNCSIGIDSQDQLWRAIQGKGIYVCDLNDVCKERLWYQLNIIDMAFDKQFVAVANAKDHVVDFINTQTLVSEKSITLSYFKLNVMRLNCIAYCENKLYVGTRDSAIIYMWDLDAPLGFSHRISVRGSVDSMAIDSKRNIWAANFDSSRIDMLQRYGSFAGSDETRCVNSLRVPENPHRIRLDRHDNIYVCDKTRTLLIYNTAGQFRTVLTSHVSIQDVAVDRFNRIYVVSDLGEVHCYGFDWDEA